MQARRITTYIAAVATVTLCMHTHCGAYPAVLILGVGAGMRAAVLFEPCRTDVQQLDRCQVTAAWLA